MSYEQNLTDNENTWTKRSYNSDLEPHSDDIGNNDNDENYQKNKVFRGNHGFDFFEDRQPKVFIEDNFEQPRYHPSKDPNFGYDCEYNSKKRPLNSHEYSENNYQHEDALDKFNSLPDKFFPPNGQKGFSCAWINCNSVFPNRSRVKRHYFTHIKIKPFKCKNPECKKRFNRQDNYGCSLYKKLCLY